jgi:hypothetical protein
MNGQTLVERIRESKQTELERLRSEKALLAVTGADLSAGAILERLALTLDGLRWALDGWADGATTGAEREAVADAAVAVALDDEYDRVVAALDGEPAGETPVPVEALRGFDDPVERVAALVGHGLVFDGTLLQAVSFFVNEADADRADLVRDLRSGANGRVDAGATALDSLCVDDADWERAQAAAADVVEAAYREYVGTLDELGIDPKPVC